MKYAFSLVLALSACTALPKQVEPTEPPAPVVEVEVMDSEGQLLYMLLPVVVACAYLAITYYRERKP